VTANLTMLAAACQAFKKEFSRKAYCISGIFSDSLADDKLRPASADMVGTKFV